MRLLAVHNDKRVIIVEFLIEGEILKAVYIDEDGEIDLDSASNFAIPEEERLPING